MHYKAIIRLLMQCDLRTVIVYASYYYFSLILLTVVEVDLQPHPTDDAPSEGGCSC